MARHPAPLNYVLDMLELFARFASMRRREKLLLPQFFNFVLEQQFLSFQFDQFQIVGSWMRLLGGYRVFDGLMTTLKFHKVRI
jgi:hypothetical protein